MSQIALSPPAGGTGVFTIAAPATNTNQTLTLPDNSGTVLAIDSAGAVNNSSGVVNLGSGQLVKDASGNVGIGTSSPTYKLDVQSATNALVNIKTNTTGFALLALDSAASNQAIAIFKAGGVEQARIFSAANEAASTLVFARGTAATESMRIDSSGQLKTMVTGGTAVMDAYAARAWVNFNGTGTVAIRASGNVSSITRNGVGNYTVNFATAMPDANFAFNATGGNVGGNSGAIRSDSGRTTSALPLLCLTQTGSALMDIDAVAVSIFR